MSGSRTVEIREERGRGTRGGPYVYVVEGNRLVHIGEYAIKKLLGKFKDEVIYEVPLEKVSGKVLYCFDFSRSGGESICKCRIEDFEDGRPKKYEYYDLLGKRIHEIHNLKFKVKDPDLIALISEFNKLFIPLIQEIKEYGEDKGFEYWFMGHLARLENAFRDPELYYYTFMSLPNDRSRIGSLRVTRRWIYQLWVLKLVCECLQVSKFTYHVHERKPFWWIEQGSDFSTCVGETPLGEVTFWLEFQPSKGAHMWGVIERYRDGLARVAPQGMKPKVERIKRMVDGMRVEGVSVGKRVAVRPDIVVVKGRFERTREFIESGKAIDALIECKEDPIEKWKGEIESQVLPYLELFKPELFILASLKPVPIGVKSYLESKGIKVVDNLKPDSKSINILCNLLRKEFVGKHGYSSNDK